MSAIIISNGVGTKIILISKTIYGAKKMQYSQWFWDGEDPYEVLNLTKEEKFVIELSDWSI